MAPSIYGAGGVQGKQHAAEMSGRHCPGDRLPNMMACWLVQCCCLQCASGALVLAGQEWLIGKLPAEVVCSDNLHAWRRLTPYGPHTGLAALLRDAQRLLRAPYFSAGLHLYRCPGILQVPHVLTGAGR